MAAQVTWLHSLHFPVSQDITSDKKLFKCINRLNMHIFSFITEVFMVSKWELILTPYYCLVDLLDSIVVEVFTYFNNIDLLKTHKSLKSINPISLMTLSRLSSRSTWMPLCTNRDENMPQQYYVCPERIVTSYNLRIHLLSCILCK